MRLGSEGAMTLFRLAVRLMGFLGGLRCSHFRNKLPSHIYKCGCFVSPRRFSTPTQ